jgi:hypothetical protein
MAHDESVAIPTQRPSTAELTAELLAAAGGNLTEEQLRDCGIDTLHVLYCVAKAGGTVLVDLRDGNGPRLMKIVVPGLFGIVG